jgi:hypothetical protein
MPIHGKRTVAIRELSKKQEISCNISRIACATTAGAPAPEKGVCRAGQFLRIPTLKKKKRKRKRKRKRKKRNNQLIRGELLRW